MARTELTVLVALDYVADYQHRSGFDRDCAMTATTIMFEQTAK